MGQPLTACKVAVIDDQPITRRGLADLLAGTPGFVLCGQGASVASAREWVWESDVVILDLYLAGDRPDLEAIAWISCRSKVLVFSASGRGADVLAAMEAGAMGYLTKRAPYAAILEAIVVVASGGRFLSDHSADLMRAEAERRSHLEVSRLSPREEEALRLIAQGLTHYQGARRMGVSEATFNTYVRRVRKKLDLGNKADLTRASLALAERLAEQPVRPDADALASAHDTRAAPGHPDGQRGWSHRHHVHASGVA